uniref:Poly [ADP-ribose] polymerase n=1 Tax=Parastrongyloides trichosuri TaxID=131310 RepID=A0A0N4ZE10_PARTI
MGYLSSKSINYCFGSPGQSGFLTLVDAAVGISKNLLQSDSSISSKLKKTEHSVKGEGIMIPKNEIKLENDVSFYTGPIVDNPSHKKDEFCLQYNEYIVYNVDQVR